MLKQSQAVPSRQITRAAAELVRRIFTALKPDETTDVSRSEPASFAYWLPTLTVHDREKADGKG